MTDAQDTPNAENTIENGAEKTPERENAEDMENTIENGAEKEGTFEGELDSEGRSGDKEKSLLILVSVPLPMSQISFANCWLIPLF